MAEQLVLARGKFRDIELPREVDLVPRLTPLGEGREHRVTTTLTDAIAKVLSLDGPQSQRRLVRPSLWRLGQRRVPPRGARGNELSIVIGGQAGRAGDGSSPLLAGAGDPPDAPPRQALPIDHARDLPKALAGAAADDAIVVAGVQKRLDQTQLLATRTLERVGASGVPALDLAEGPRDEQEVACAPLDRAHAREHGLGERVADRAEPEFVAGLGTAKQLDDLERAPALGVGEVKPCQRRHTRLGSATTARS